MEPPKLITMLAQVPDNEATGRGCREWRVFHRAKLVAVAAFMEISAPMLHYLETGRKGWTQDKVTLFLRAVKKAANRRERP